MLGFQVVDAGGVGSEEVVAGGGDGLRVAEVFGVRESTSHPQPLANFASSFWHCLLLVFI